MKSANDITAALTRSLNPRQAEVIEGRFGLERFKKPQTLAALGKKYGITRERVRQIEVGALAALRERVAEIPECQAILADSRKVLKNAGGVMRKERLLETQISQLSGLTENHFNLLLAASRAFGLHPEDEEFWAFYFADEMYREKATNFIREWAGAVSRNKKVVLAAAGSYLKELKKFLKDSGVNQVYAENYISISKRFHANPYGDVGLAEWAEIRPATIRDRIYLVLKKSGVPLHFETIAENINKAGFTGRRALPATVHNELIKDSRFILVGRGIYGLAEHGYTPGTAREVIHRILRKNGPLKPRDVVLAVQKERFLKPNTVLVNLQNKSFFQRRSDGTYTVREA